MQRMLEGLVVHHDVDEIFHRSVAQILGPENAERVRAEVTGGADHPLVIRHPLTGEKLLYVAGYWMQHVRDLSEDESRTLLDFLMRHVTQPGFQVRWRWRPTTSRSGTSAPRCTARSATTIRSAASCAAARSTIPRTRRQREWSGSVKAWKEMGSAAALAAVLAGSGCGGGDESQAPDPPAAQTQGPRAKPARMPPIAPPPRELTRQPDPPAGEQGAPPGGAHLPSISPDAPIPEGTRPLSSLPDDVPVPAGAKPVAPLLLSEENVAHGTYEMEGSVPSVTTSYTAGLLQNGWSIEPARSSGNQALITATKGNRQVSIAIEGGEGPTQIVIFEMERPER